MENILTALKYYQKVNHQSSYKNRKGNMSSYNENASILERQYPEKGNEIKSTSSVDVSSSLNPSVFLYRNKKKNRKNRQNIKSNMI